MCEVVLEFMLVREKGASSQPECFDDVPRLRTGVRGEESEAVVGDHAVDVRTALMGMHRSRKAILSGSYQNTPHTEFAGRSLHGICKFYLHLISKLRAELGVRTHAMRYPRRDKGDENHVAADWVARQPEEGDAVPRAE